MADITALEVRLIRHGPKNPSDYPNPTQRGKLSFAGKELASQFGKNLFLNYVGSSQIESYDALVVVTSPHPRAVMTGAYLLRGYNDARDGIVRPVFDDASFDDSLVPQPHIEPILKSPTLPRLDQMLDKGQINEAQEVSEYYDMIRNPEKYASEEADAVLESTRQYLSVVLQYLSGERIPAEQQAQIALAKKPVVILVGHEPHIGCVQQLLQPQASIGPVQYLDEIRFTHRGNDISYLGYNTSRFPRETYTGIVPA